MDGSSFGDSAATPYRVLARKYRPQSFDDLIGQEPMVRTLRNAFQSGRIAQAFLLTGVRGVGKTTTARILARALNYSLPGKIERPSLDFTEMGEHCATIMEGRHVDVIEMDAASHTGIGDIREIIEAVRYKPAIARYKVYIIDEVHMLSNQAFNGLLKTLEEPPEHVKFIFATTEIRKVPVTVLSRCQRFDLRRIEADRLVALLSEIAGKEQVAIEPEALAMIARAAEGSARDSLSLLDQAIAHVARGDSSAADAGPTIAAADVRGMLGLADRGRVIDLFEAVMRGDTEAALAIHAELYNAGADPVVVLQDLADFSHLVTRLRITAEAAKDPALTEEERTRGTALAEALSIRVLSRAWQILLKGIEEVKASERPMAGADMVLVRLAYAADLPTPDEALRLLKGGGAVAAPGSSVAGAGAAALAAKTVGTSRPDATATVPTRPDLAMARPVPAAAPRRDPIGGRGTGASNAAAARAAGPVASAPKPAAAVPAPGDVASFEDLVALAAAKRDLPMKIALESQVRLIAFEPGRIEVAVTEAAPANLTGDLSRRLQEWTGRRWLVVVGNGPAAPTIEEQRQTARARLVDDARADPVAAAVLARFPGAEIVDVRLRRSEGELLPPRSFGDEPPPWEPDED